MESNFTQKETQVKDAEGNSFHEQENDKINTQHQSDAIAPHGVCSIDDKVGEKEEWKVLLNKVLQGIKRFHMIV